MREQSVTKVLSAAPPSENSITRQQAHCTDAAHQAATNSPRNDPPGATKPDVISERPEPAANLQSQPDSATGSVGSAALAHQLSNAVPHSTTSAIV